MILLQRNLTIVLFLWLSSGTIFFCQTAFAQVSDNYKNLDFSQKPPSEKKTDLLPSVPLLIANLESLKNLPDSQNNLLGYVPDFVEQPKVADLEQINSKLANCTPNNIGQLEFTKVADLEAKNPKLPNCNPTIIGQAEANSKQIDPQPRVDDFEVDQIYPPEKTPRVEPDYIIPPRIGDPKKIRTFTTSIPLNGTVINHLTKSELSVSSGFGDSRNSTLDVNGIVNFNSQVQESLTRNNIFTVDQNGDYLQLQTVRKRREIITDFTEPRTVMGQHLQLSMAGSCIFPGRNPDEICSYTPGLATGDINPNTLMPKRIFQTGKVGEVLTPETLAAIRQPGFQSGANGQKVGIDLLFPNIGSFAGNSTGDKLDVSRREEIENTPSVVYSTVRQIVKANDREAVMARTVRGFGFILNDDNTLLNTVLQLGYSLLPDIFPSIAGSSNPVNSNVNNNLFLAANNVRLPANSFTAYHGGIGHAQSLPRKATNLNQVPAASFNGIWLGVSPVIKRSYEIQTRNQIIGPQQVLFAGGGEGGYSSNFSFVSSINNQTFATADLQDFYTQVYLSMSNQEVNSVTTHKYKEETNYVPHISFTGNITGSQDVFRYYTGVIGAEEIKAYGGMDFTKKTSNGWTFSGGFLAYINPDIDYYSQAVGSVAKRIPFSKNSNLVVSAGVNYAFDKEAYFNTEDDYVNSLTLKTQVNLGNFSFGLTNYFGDILPDSVNNMLVTNVAFKFNKHFALSAYYAPINENAARSVYGAGARFILGDNQNSPILSLSWKNNEYDYGKDISGNQLGTNENVFTVLLKGNF
ncbi:MAG: hypothetical protein ACFKPT_14130 [Gloeotrichia echinulata GP01]